MIDSAKAHTNDGLLQLYDGFKTATEDQKDDIFRSYVRAVENELKLRNVPFEPLPSNW